MKTLKAVALMTSALLAGSLMFGANDSHALSFSFSDQDYLAGASWGTMVIDVEDENSLKISFTTSNSVPEGAEATGFGFAFTTDPTAVENPLDGDFATDEDDLDWVKLTSLSAIPQPANGDEFTPPVTKEMFFFGATEGNAHNLSPPGIAAGEMDIFFLNFVGVDFAASGFDLTGFVDLTGVRLQSFTEDINGGSIFLVGDTPDDPPNVPEPGTLLLLGSGLLGLALYRRRNTAN